MDLPPSSTLPPYEYTELEDAASYLRILRIYPSNQKDSDINCEFVEVPFDGDQGYEALSWCWGIQKHDRLIRVHKDGSVFALKVTYNLESALRAMRCRYRERFLWVDMVCINQACTAERNKQVSKMDRIYGQAWGICIWLGEEDEDSKMAISFIRNKVLQIGKHDELCENTKYYPLWGAFIRLMGRPWFFRRWVIQEIALSRKATIYCGRKKTSWKVFAAAVSLLVEAEARSFKLSRFINPDNSPGGVQGLGAVVLVEATSNLVRSSTEGNKEPQLLSSLEYLVSSLPIFQTSQPRDAIYALLAIAQDTMVQTKYRESSTSLAYHVDYTQPVIDVYREFVDFSISNSEKSRALDIICRPWAPKFTRKQERVGLEEPDGQQLESELDEEDLYVTLPSWIRSLSESAFGVLANPWIKTAPVSTRRINANTLVGLPIAGHRNYSAAGTEPVTELKHMFKKRSNHHSMFVEGFVLDKVKHMYEPSKLGHIPRAWLKHGKWKNLQKDPPEAFWRTLVADRASNGRNPPTYYPRACRESLRKPTGEAFDIQQLINEGPSTIVAEFLRRVQAVIWNRRLIETENERLGLVHIEVEEGYEICILYGCSVPVVLQKVLKTQEEIQQELDDDINEDQHQEKFQGAHLLKRALEKWRTRKSQDEETQRAEKQHWKAKATMAMQFIALALVACPLLYMLIFIRRFYTFNLLLVASSICLWFATSPIQFQELPSEESGGRRIQGWSLTFSIGVRDALQICIHIALIIRTNPLQLIRAMKNLSATIGVFFPMAPTALTLVGLECIGILLLLLLDRSWFIDIRTSIEPAPMEEPEESYYRFCGECYVHGMMNGEAIAYQNEHGIKGQVFELR